MYTNTCMFVYIHGLNIEWMKYMCSVLYIRDCKCGNEVPESAKITQKPLGQGGVDVHIDEFAMHQLEASIHFATTRHGSKTVLNNVISVTASMQTQETKWDDSYQAFISKSRLWQISTIIDQLY
jgi:hypothetical protein